MKEPALEKIYLLLGKGDGSVAEALDQMLLGVLPYANVNANLYLVMDEPLEAPAQRDRLDKIFSVVQRHLEAYLFTRLFVHLVHPVSLDSFKETERCYERLKENTRSFDQEGYMHQEVPRLMLLPLIVVDDRIDWQALTPFFTSLRRSFLPPSLFVGGNLDTVDMSRLENVGAEKIYWGTGAPDDVTPLLSNLARQDIVDDSSSRLAAGMAVNTPCPQSLIVSVRDGRIFPCFHAYRKEKHLAVIDKDLDVPAMMENHQKYWSSITVCPGCRENLALSFSALPLAQETKQEIGALLYHFGTLHEKLGQLDKAVSSYKDSLRLSPASEADAIHFRLGLCYTMQGQYEEALLTFERARSAYDNTHFFHFYAGLCFFHLGDYNSALEKFVTAESLNPPKEDAIQILIYAGTCHNYMAQYEAGLKPLEKAKELAPQVKEVWSTLGFSFFQLKKFDSAIDHLKKAVELDPFSAVDYASLGANYREAGDVTRAVAMFEKALSLDPSMAAAKENLERLKKLS